jgi:cysteine desulfurase
VGKFLFPDLGAQEAMGHSRDSTSRPHRTSLALADRTAYPETSTMNRVYLDYNATTPVEPKVLDAMLPYFSGDYGNASSIHTFGQRARGAVETAREQVAALIGARPQEIIFTSGGTEADNHAIFGIAEAAAASSWQARGRSTDASTISSSLGGRGFSHGVTPAAEDRLPPVKAFSFPYIITTAIEHEAVLNTCQALEKRGLSVAYLAVDRDGQIDLDALRESLREHPETVLITIMHANNELGTVQPLEEIGRIAAEADVYFHTDAVQSAGKVPIDVNALNLDLLSLSGHKLYAPKGIGALYIRGGTRLRQFLFGGHHQRGFRPGTENVAGIVGLGKAAQIAKASLAEDAKRVAALRDTLERTLLQRVPDSRVNGAGASRTPNTTNVTFPGIEGEALVIALDLKGLACSTGAACSSGAVEPSHVLTAIGLPAEEARASLRFSLGRHTTAADIDFALQAIPAAVAQLRELSPTYGKAPRAEVHP